MQKSIKIQIALCFILVLVHFSALATNKVVRLGVENLNYKPIIWFEDDVPKGFIPELIAKFSEESGIKFVITAYPVSRLKKEAAEGKVDLQFPDNPNWRVDINKPKSYSVPIVPYTDGYYSKNRDIYIKAVGTPLGFTVVARPEWKLNIANSTTLNSLFSMLDKDRIDAIYLNTTVARNVINAKKSKIVFREDMPLDRSFFYFSSTNSSNYINALNNFITSNKHYTAKLLESYGLTDTIEKKINKSGFNVGYSIIPSAPDFSDFSEVLNPFKGMEKIVGTLIESPMTSAKNRFCRNETVAVYPSFPNQIDCPHHFQEIFKIRSYWVARKGLNQIQNIGLIAGANYAPLNLPNNIEIIEVDNDTQLVNLLREDKIDSIIIERENLLKIARNMNYDIVKEYSIPVGYSVKNEIRAQFKKALVSDCNKVIPAN